MTAKLEEEYVIKLVKERIDTFEEQYLESSEEKMDLADGSGLSAWLEHPIVILCMNVYMKFLLSLFGIGVLLLIWKYAIKEETLDEFFLTTASPEEQRPFIPRK